MTDEPTPRSLREWRVTYLLRALRTTLDSGANLAKQLTRAPGISSILTLGAKGKDLAENPSVSSNDITSGPGHETGVL